MKSLKSLIHKNSALRKKTSLDDKTVFYIFKKIIREEFGNVGAEKLIPDYFSQKTIFIKSDSANWKSELWLNQGKIIRKINQELGGEAIEKIKTK